MRTSRGALTAEAGTADIRAEIEALIARIDEKNAGIRTLEQAAAGADARIAVLENDIRHNEVTADTLRDELRAGSRAPKRAGGRGAPPTRPSARRWARDRAAAPAHCPAGGFAGRADGKKAPPRANGAASWKRSWSRCPTDWGEAKATRRQRSLPPCVWRPRQVRPRRPGRP